MQLVFYLSEQYLLLLNTPWIAEFAQETILRYVSVFV